LFISFHFSLLSHLSPRFDLQRRADSNCGHQLSRNSVTACLGTHLTGA
jgi:hypothetical protein